MLIICLLLTYAYYMLIINLCLLDAYCIYLYLPSQSLCKDYRLTKKFNVHPNIIKI